MSDCVCPCFLRRNYLLRSQGQAWAGEIDFSVNILASRDPWWWFGSVHRPLRKVELPTFVIEKLRLGEVGWFAWDYTVRTRLSLSWSPYFTPKAVLSRPYHMGRVLPCRHTSSLPPHNPVCQVVCPDRQTSPKASCSPGVLHGSAKESFPGSALPRIRTHQESSPLFHVLFTHSILYCSAHLWHMLSVGHPIWTWTRLQKTQ